MEAEMLVDMRGAAVQRLSDDTGNDYVIDCRRRRSPDGASIDAAGSENLIVGRHAASPMSAKATYWSDVIDSDKMAARPLRRCESRDSDVSVTSLPESLASDDDVAESPKLVSGWTGSSYAATARQPEVKTADIDVVKSTSGDWSRDSAVRPSPPTAVGFSIADILRPDFGKTPSGGGHAQRESSSVGRCPSYAPPGAAVSLQLSSSFRRSLVHPYAAAFCAAAVAAAAAAGVHQGRAGVVRGGSTDPAARRPELPPRQQVRRLTSSGDVTYRALNNNNNNAKLGSRYAYDDKEVVGHGKTSAAERRTRGQQPSPSSLSAATKPVVSRPDQSAVFSPPAASTAAAATDTQASVVDVKQAGAGDGGSSPGLMPLPWPAWVYCTRYSDRPSSGTSIYTRAE